MGFDHGGSASQTRWRSHSVQIIIIIIIIIIYYQLSLSARFGLLLDGCTKYFRYVCTEGRTKTKKCPSWISVLIDIMPFD